MFKLLDNLPVSLDIDDVLRGQGADPAKASPSLIRIATKALEEARPLLNPAVLYGTLPVTGYRHDQVTFKGGAFSGPLVARALAGAAGLTMAVCTIGPALEKRSDELMSNLMQALALDGAGTAAIEKLSRLLVEIIRADAERNGLKTGMKINPGQEGWPIEQQQVLFSLVPAEEIGVRLTENSLMIPRKSVSFVIGSGKEMCAESVSCDFCSKRERCRWRHK